MTSPGPGLVLAVVLDTSRELANTAMLPQLSGALTTWADAARADGRRGRARVVIVGAGEPAAVVGGPFTDLADLQAPPLATGGPPRWAVAVRHAVALCETEATVAGQGAGPVPVLVFVVDDVSLPKVAGADLDDLRKLGADLGVRGRRERSVYVLAAGHHGPDQVSESLVPDAYFTIDPLDFAGAFAVLDLAIEVVTPDGPVRLLPQDAARQIRQALAQSHRPAPVFQERPAADPAPAPLPAEPAVTRYVSRELPPLAYGRSRREKTTLASVVALLAVLAGCAGLVGAGRPGAAVVALGVFVAVTLALLLLIRR